MDVTCLRRIWLAAVSTCGLRVCRCRLGRRRSCRIYRVLWSRLALYWRVWRFRWRRRFEVVVVVAVVVEVVEMRKTADLLLVVCQRRGSCCLRR